MYGSQARGGIRNAIWRTVGPLHIGEVANHSPCKTGTLFTSGGPGSATAKRDKYSQRRGETSSREDRQSLTMQRRGRVEPQSDPELRDKVRREEKAESPIASVQCVNTADEVS